MLDLKQVNGYILTGGFSRRFGSDKALAKINNHTFTEELFETLLPILKSVSVVGKKQYFGNIPFIEDNLDIQCPMVGLYSALKQSDTDWNFIINVDMPLIDKEIVQYLASKNSGSEKIVAPKVDNKIYPLCAFYHSTLQDSILKSINKKSYKLMDFIENISNTVTMNKHSDKFINVNTKQDLNKIA